MKHLLQSHLLCLFLFIHLVTGSVAQSGVWTTLPDFPGVSRYAATGFAINGKGYVITGYHSTGPVLLNDTWEYNPVDSSWTQKAPFPGGARWYCSSFSINGKGYVGMGATTNDFWEFDPVANTWTQKNNFPGPARAEAVAFSIGGKGYMGLGAPYGTSSFMQDFWEYNPLTDTWVQLGNFPGGPRGFAISFVIGQKAYVGTGDSPGFNVYNNDLWEFNPAGNSWVQKANMPVKRTQAVAFSIGNYGYVGMGASINGQFVFPKDNWRFNPLTNQWDSLPPLPYYKWALPVTFSFGNKAYVVTGFPDESNMWKFSVKNDYLTDLKQEKVEDHFYVSPNPSAGIFELSYSGKPLAPFKIRVTDVQGRNVFTRSFDTAPSGLFKIDLRELDKGIYFLESATDGSKAVRKIIIE